MTHLCTGGEAPWLRSHDGACRRFGELKSGGMAGRDAIFGVYQRAKEQVASRLGIAPARVAFLAHASEGLNQAVARGRLAPGRQRRGRGRGVPLAPGAPGAPARRRGGGARRARPRPLRLHRRPRLRRRPAHAPAAGEPRQLPHRAAPRPLPLRRDRPWRGGVARGRRHPLPGRRPGGRRPVRLPGQLLLQVAARHARGRHLRLRSGAGRRRHPHPPRLALPGPPRGPRGAARAPSCTGTPRASRPATPACSTSSSWTTPSARSPPSRCRTSWPTPSPSETPSWTASAPAAGG